MIWIIGIVKLLQVGHLSCTWSAPVRTSISEQHHVYESFLHAVDEYKAHLCLFILLQCMLLWSSIIIQTVSYYLYPKPIISCNCLRMIKSRVCCFGVNAQRKAYAVADLGEGWGVGWGSCGANYGC